MTREETSKILTVIKYAYPSFYKDYSENDLIGAVGVWYEQLNNETYQTVSTAVTMIISTSKFAPTIADVKEKIYELANPDILSSNDAWLCVKKAIQNSTYNSKEEFEKLSEIAKKIVGDAYQLKIWAMESENTLDTVIASNFKKAYKAETENCKNKYMLGAVQKQLASGAVEMLSDKSDT